MALNMRMRKLPAGNETYKVTYIAEIFLWAMSQCPSHMSNVQRPTVVSVLAVSIEKIV